MGIERVSKRKITPLGILFVMSANRRDGRIPSAHPPRKSGLSAWVPSMARSEPGKSFVASADLHDGTKDANARGQ